ncbi:hypothetical protein TNCV_4149521 [Trichonephila clavipes]|uniref:Uncharacterized protein n=1 Tax=Trichonephila clavipes TaxID=2585209 RepID=A0A8X6W620_TRICX|nr:hypothetical protein TNCV_4149521 [Trichonephila clavipes]
MNQSVSIILINTRKNHRAIKSESRVTLNRNERERRFRTVNALPLPRRPARPRPGLKSCGVPGISRSNVSLKKEGAKITRDDEKRVLLNASVLTIEKNEVHSSMICHSRTEGKRTKAVILAPDEGCVETSWKSPGGTDAGEAIGIGETVGVRSCLCIGLAGIFY